MCVLWAYRDWGFNERVRWEKDGEIKELCEFCAVKLSFIIN